MQMQSISSYIDDYHQHVVTGDLSIVKDDLLRNFMEKGIGFRLMITKNKSIVMKQIIKDLDKFYLKMAIKYGMPIEAFNQFRSYVATEIRELDFTVENEIMYKDLKSSIENIQNDFVITYVDEVSANYAIICKYFYSKLLCNHILNNNSFQKSIHIDREDDNRLLALNKRLNIHLNNIKYPKVFF
ncbi:hypothetical protein TNCV_120851 [Trichonephila clavipes]|nr:hypothetical protein TNCV_120851 [Trichonephila clavipes]